MTTLIPIPTVAERLSIPVAAVRDLIGHLELPVVRVSERRLRVSEAALEKFVKDRTLLW